ncbi:MAG: ATP-dependent helicase, partial [Bacteroidia bacterium]|nr:ATP-dependent helicase [Bacteroidia bacterium]
DIQIILLEENYRSTQDILDVCGRSIAFNQKRLVHSSGLFGNEKVLKASNTSLGASHPKPVIKAYENHFYELTDLLNQIQTLIATGVKPSEIAVLYRKHAQSEALMTLLSDRDMVYSTKRTINVLHEPIIRNVRILLSYVAQQYEDFNAEDNLLFRLLHLPFFDTQSLDLAKLGFYLSSLSMDEDAIPWRVAISDSMLLEQLKIESPNSLLQVGNLIDDWTKSMDSYSLQGFVEYILTSSGVLNYILEHRDRDWNIQLLTTFYNYIKAEIRKNPLLKLADLMNTIDLMDQTGVALPYHKTIYTNDGINLLTAHGAKGLEFENVFLLEVTKDRWQSNRGGGFQFSYPDTITQTSKEDAAESQRRLFYVAMSRAKTHLQISYPEYSDTEKKLQRAGFIDEIEATGFHQVYPDVNNEDVVETQIALLSQALKPKIALPLESLITERLEQFRMSPSALNSYLACPINFFYNYILKVPSIQSEPASYGMAMHAALEKLFNKMLSDDDKAFMESEELIASFEAYMVRQRGAFSTKGFDFHFAKGKKNLVMLYDKKVDEWEKKVETEKFINDVAMSGVPLKGTIDKIEFMGSNLVRLVDYKSGKFDKKRVAAPNDKNPEGGPYWRQLVFYKLLFEGSSYANGRKAQSAMIAYVDSNREDQFDEYAVEFDPDQESKLIEILTATYAKIMNHEFDEGCEEERCQWCQFVKDSKLDVSSEIGFAVVDEDMIRDE